MTAGCDPFFKIEHKYATKYNDTLIETFLLLKKYDCISTKIIVGQLFNLVFGRSRYKDCSRKGGAVLSNQFSTITLLCKIIRIFLFSNLIFFVHSIQQCLYTAIVRHMKLKTQVCVYPLSEGSK